MIIGCIGGFGVFLLITAVEISTGLTMSDMSLSEAFHTLFSEVRVVLLLHVAYEEKIDNFFSPRFLDYYGLCTCSTSDGISENFDMHHGERASVLFDIAYVSFIAQCSHLIMYILRFPQLSTQNVLHIFENYSNSCHECYHSNVNL